MFDFSLGNFKLADAAKMVAGDTRRAQTEKPVSTRAYITGKNDGGYQGLTADGRRVSNMVDPFGVSWGDQWVTVEWTETGPIIAGPAAFDSGAPDPVVDPDE